MSSCVKCGSYTKYQGGLCSNCYNDKSHSSTSDNNEALEFSEKEKNYRYNMIKGRIAETLVQELFLSLGYNVFRYGMENTIPGVMDLLRGIRSDVAEHIRQMPDFVIQNRTTKDVYFAEVKFRANGEFAYHNLSKNYPYNNAFIIVVSKKHIKCLSVEELASGKEITSDSRNYLGNRKEFELDKDVIIEFCKFATQFFETV